MTRCYACSRVLTNPESISLGIGPICRARRKRELDDQEKLDREARKCHHGFACANPRHVETLLGRLMHKTELWPDWLQAEAAEYGVEVDIEGCKRLGALIGDHAGAIIDALGLRRAGVQVPLVEHQSLEVMLRATGQFLNPINEIQPGQYRIPGDVGIQYRNTVLRGLGICPHGLDCREPERAVAAIYSILGLLRHEVEPIFARTCYGGLVGASDAAYVACANMLEVLGLEGEASSIHYQDLPRLRKVAQRNARRWERQQARKRGAA